MADFERPPLMWPAWIDDLLLWGPIDELETEWKAAIGDAITHVLDQRREALARATPERDADA